MSNHRSVDFQLTLDMLYPSWSKDLFTRIRSTSVSVHASRSSDLTTKEAWVGYSGAANRSPPKRYLLKYGLPALDALPNTQYRSKYRECAMPTVYLYRRSIKLASLNLVRQCYYCRHNIPLRPHSAQYLFASCLASTATWSLQSHFLSPALIVTGYALVVLVSRAPFNWVSTEHLFFHLGFCPPWSPEPLLLSTLVSLTAF